MAFVDRTGQRYGRLLAVKRVENDKHGKARWECLCDCGNTTVVAGGDFKKTQSCGCRGLEILAQRNLTHGMSEDTMYGRWCNMNTRCYNPNSPSYPRYGGRGITICDRWTHFENFYADMGEPPFEGAQIDRIDNDKGYSKDNCRWVTIKENNRNRGNRYRIPHLGAEITLTEASEILGISRDTLKYAGTKETKEQRTARIAALLAEHIKGD